MLGTTSNCLIGGEAGNAEVASVRSTLFNLFFFIHNSPIRCRLSLRLSLLVFLRPTGIELRLLFPTIFIMATQVPLADWLKSSYRKITGKLEDDEVLEEERKQLRNEAMQSKTKSRSTSQIVLITIVTIVLVIFATLMTKALFFGKNSDHSFNNSHQPCGNSSSEALAKGCRFDQLTWSWLPQKCPHYANEEFKKVQDWKYYVDRNGTQEAAGDNWDKAMNNEIPLYTISGEHSTHCVYLLLGMAKIIRDGSPIIPKMTDYPHLEHCAKHIIMKLKDSPDFEKVRTLTPDVSYGQYC